MSQSNEIATRPGGRTSEVGSRVARAVRELLEGGGYSSISYQEVSDRASVGRATLYRRWPTRAELALFGISEVVTSEVIVADKRSFTEDLSATLTSIANFIQSPLGRATLIASLEIDAHTGSKASLWNARAVEIKALFDRAIGRGDIPADTDWDALFSMASGALYFRLIAADQPIDADWIARVVRLCTHAL